jgi:subtilase family serine protease
LRHTFGPDLEVSSDEISLSNPNPSPGTTVQIQATLHNVGDRAVVNPKAAFYLGDPALGGDLIGEKTANLTLTGGMTTTLGVEWTVPPGGPFSLYVIADPDGVVDERDEDNNKAHITAVVPDLVTRDVWVNYGRGQIITLTTVISNAGVVAASNVPIAFRLNDPLTGAVVAQTTVDRVGVGAESWAEAVWDASTIATGWHKIYALSDPDDVIVEANEENNMNWAGVGILPDLALYPTAIVTGTNNMGGTEVSVWVFNEGMRDARGVVVGLYNLKPVSGTVPLASTSMDIPAEGYKVANLNLSYTVPGFYVGVNINQEVEERDVSNNVILVGEVPYWLYLPLVLKGL